jgi:hypothetical protein
MQFAIQTDSGLVFEETRGRFHCRRFVQQEYIAVKAIIARRVETDVSNFARLARRHPIAIVAPSRDPFDGFCDESDFPRYGQEGGPL